MRTSPEDPSWIASRTGHDWRDEDVLRSVAWLTDLTDQQEWAKRLETTQDQFFRAKEEWAKGNQVPLYDPRDTAAWYMFQASAYASDRMNWVPEEAVRIVPTLTRFGQELDTLLAISGTEKRAARLINEEKAQPDSGLFELLVALAYQRDQWTTKFIPEQPGRARTPDIFVSKGRRKWAVECKRMDRSSYYMREKDRGDALAKQVHDLSLSEGRSIAMSVVFDEELFEIPDDYLESRALDYFRDERKSAWFDELGMGHIHEIDWELVRSVLEDDDVYFGSSRMIELLIGAYDHDLAHSMAGKWRPSAVRPFWAEALYQASVVRWKNDSSEAIRKKARHFRSTVASALGQLPQNRPSVIHVGVESWSGGDVDAARHFLNKQEMSNFDPGDTRLRWVYGEYMVPEVTTRSNESWAVEETSASYRVGRHGTAEPLPNHMLLTPEEKINLGVHWNPAGQRPLQR